jgi:hypothetical protein
MGEGWGNGYLSSQSQGRDAQRELFVKLGLRAVLLHQWPTEITFAWTVSKPWTSRVPDTADKQREEGVETAAPQVWQGCSHFPCVKGTS